MLTSTAMLPTSNIAPDRRRFAHWRAVMEDETSGGILAHTAEIVAAYVGHQSVAMADLPEVIGSVFKTLRRAGQIEEPAPAARPEPAVSIRKSVTETFLV